MKKSSGWKILRQQQYVNLPDETVKSCYLGKIFQFLPVLIYQITSANA
jgi:hypothetical protein